MTGASRVKGAIVIARYRATRPRASSVGTEKNTVVASATVIIMSPAPLMACSSISLPRPDSPAPCACVARRIPRAVPVKGRCRACPTARPARLAGPEPSWDDRTGATLDIVPHPALPGASRRVAEPVPCPRIGPCMCARGLRGGSVRSAPPAVAPGRAPLRDPAEWIAVRCARSPIGCGRRRGPLVRSARATYGQHRRVVVDDSTDGAHVRRRRRERDQ